MNNCKICAKLLFVGMCMTYQVTNGDETVIVQVNDSVCQLTQSLLCGDSVDLAYIREFGFKYLNNTNYLMLAAIVSNENDYVFANFQRCATNEASRLMLLSSGWAYDAAYFLHCFSNVLILAENSIVSNDEFEWFRMANRRADLLEALPLQYDLPGVSNLVMRMQQCTGETNYCQRILSGQAKMDVLEWHKGEGGMR